MNTDNDTVCDVIECAAEWQSAGRRIALATVVRTWGSAPVPVGNQLLIDDRGEFEGSVSGGCVEGAVIEAAQDVIRSDASRILKFSVADELAWEVGLSCGGEIEIFLESVS